MKSTFIHKNTRKKYKKLKIGKKSTRNGHKKQKIVRGGAFSNRNIEEKDTCLDIIMFDDENINEYVSQKNDKGEYDNIVFKSPVNDSYICSSKSQIKELVKDPRNILMTCKGGPNHFLEFTSSNVCGLKLAKIASLGIGYGGFITLKNLDDVVLNNKNNDTIFEIEEYPEKISVTAILSLKIMPGQHTLDEAYGDLLLGAAHCQSGYEGQIIYRIVSKSVPDYRENPHIWKTMMKNKCINIGDEDELLINEAEPIKVRPSEYFYKNAADENAADETNRENSYNESDLSYITQEDISQENIHKLVEMYYKDKTKLHENLQNISTWDVSRVTDMSNLFKNKDNFNEDISNWNVSNVTNMESMFYGT